MKQGDGTVTLPHLTTRLAIWTLALIALVWLAGHAQEVLAPMVMGLVLGIVGAPLADRLDRLGLPRALLATAMMLAAIALIVLLMLALGPAISELVDQFPRIQLAVQDWLSTLRDLARGLDRMGAELTQSSPDVSEEPLPDMADAIWIAPNLGAQLLIIVGTFFFFTLTRPTLYARMNAVRARLVRAESRVAHYFATVTVINTGLGLCVMVAIAALGMPNPHLWGAAAGLLNFFLYLGPIVMIAALTVAGMTLFQGPQAFLPPAVFLMLNLIEAQFVTPALVGQQMDVNPLYVFLAVVFGLWIWGPIGAMVALPLLLWTTELLGPGGAGTNLPSPR